MDTQEYVTESVRESLGGIVSGLRAEGRYRGKTKLRATIPLEALRKRVAERINGYIRSGDAQDDLRAPTREELFANWLPPLIKDDKSAKLTATALELVIDIPPPRRAHAR